MKYIYRFALPFLFLLFIACGDVPVNIDQDTYDPKIVIDGYIFPGKTPSGIRISRNYPLNEKIDISDFLLADADVTLKDRQENRVYELGFNPMRMGFGYEGNELLIEYGKSYELQVQAEIDGKDLYTSCITTVPEQGFSIDRQASDLDPRSYDTAVKTNDKFEIAFYTSPTTGSYLVSIVALDASVDTFIEDNVLGLQREDLDDSTDPDEAKYFDYSKNQIQWYETKSGAGSRLSRLDIEWFSTWFYGRYRVIVYAADKNFTDFFLTADAIQEIDGNLLEPEFHIQGDGIGVFGSAIADTTYFEILR